MDPEETLRRGCELLDAVLVPAGFRFALKEAGQGSGGRFATGDYVSGRRRLELHFRRSLGLVTYHWDGSSVSHEGLMRALGAAGRHEYPGFSDDPLDGFRHLQRDIECYGQVFLAGSDEDFSHLLAEAQRLEALRPKGIAGIPGIQ